MTDIVERLRSRVSDDECWHNAREAADEIERLRAANDELVDANGYIALDAGRLRSALSALVADVLEYERINNLSPNPGKPDCWQSVTNAKKVLTGRETAPT